MADLILHIGSNLGDRAAYLAAARRAIRNQIGHIHRCSAIFQTAAWGLENQPDFYNQALWVWTKLDAVQCLDYCQQIEQELDRKRVVHWGPRTIDIDMIAYNHEVHRSARLILPHPRLQDRNFVLKPLMELIPQWQHPVLGLKVTDLDQQSKDPLPAIRIADEVPWP